MSVIDALEGFQARPVDAHGGIDLGGCDMIFDATVLSASRRIVSAAGEAGIPVIVATSGWTAADAEALAADDAKGVRIIPNFSIGSVVATHIATVAARHLDYAEVIEAHHDGKRDAPSGTATRTAERIAQIRPQTPPTPDEPGRGTMVAGVPVHALRMPGVSAWQEVRFGGTGETLTIRHDTLTSESYAAGIRLAISSPPPAGVAIGLDDLLGLI